MSRSTTPANPPPGSIFGAVVALPHGRHRLSREEVAASQRQRLLAAVTALVAERGYANLTITEVARRARVAPNRFYEHFSGREAAPWMPSRRAPGHSSSRPTAPDRRRAGGAVRRTRSSPR
jgi:hypothetical protein